MYSEQGDMNVEGKSRSVYQKYKYILNEDSCQVYFTNGNLFYTVSENSNIIHYCGNDVYRGEYEVFDDNEGFKLTWTVTGPHKDYISETIFKTIANP